MRYSTTLMVGFLFATVCLVSPAWAGNIVTDPGFETLPALTGWTTNSTLTNFPWTIDGDGGPGAHSGSHYASTGCVGASCITADPAAAGAWLYQDLATTTGQSYNLSFWYNSAGSSGTDLQVLWGGTSVFDLVNIATGYNQYSTTVVGGAGATTRLEFLGRQDPGFLGLDDVNVDNAAPEPATLALLAGGFLLIGGLRRRRA